MKISRSLMVLGLLLVMLVLPIMASGSDTLLAEPTVPVSSAVPSLPPAISAQAAIVTDDVGQVLWSRNADVRMPMASTTKIMTALTVLAGSDDLDRAVTVPGEAGGVEGAAVYLFEGETLTLGQLLDAVLIESANDAATALAIAVAGSVEAFAGQMNTLADEMGLVDTHFVNPHGLDDAEHYTTARELAQIARTAMTYDAFAKTVSTY